TIAATEIEAAPPGQGHVTLPLKCVSANECARFRLDAAYVRVRHGAHIGRQRIQHSSRRPHVPPLFGLRRLNDLRSAAEHGVRYSFIDLVVPDLPAAADDSANGIVEPCAGASYLDFLSRGQPKSAAH